jgi:hypothetical protein
MCSKGKPVFQPVTFEKAKCVYNEMMANATFSDFWLKSIKNETVRSYSRIATV